MQRVIRAIEKLSGFLGVLSGLATLIITITVILDVALRAAFNAPILGATEFSTLLLLVLVYLGLASVQAGKANFSVEIMVAILRSEEHTSELQSLMRISYAVFCLQKKKNDQ